MGDVSRRGLDPGAGDLSGEERGAPEGGALRRTVFWFGAKLLEKERGRERERAAWMPLCLDGFWGGFLVSVFG